MTGFSATRWIAIAAMALICGCASPEARRDKFLARGKELLNQRDYARALLEFRNASQATPKDAEPYYYTGVATMQSGDLQTALMSFRKALELNPSHTNAKLRLSQLMLLGDKPVLKEAEKNIRDLMASVPVTPEMLNTLAVSEMRLGKTEDAMHTLEEALAKAPGELASSLLMARMKLAQKDFGAAEQVLKNAATSAPGRIEPHLALSRFYMSQNRINEAEQAVQRALQVNPNSGLANRDLAVLQNLTGRKKEAEQTFKRLSGLGEQRFKPVYGLFLFAEGRRQEAVREFERLAKENPDDRDARTRLVTIYQAVNRIDDARSILENALRKNSRDLDALLQRAQILAAAQKYTEAEADLNKVLQQTPDSAPAHYFLAKLHQARGAALRYRQDLTKALELDPALLSVRLELAGALIATKNEKSAIDLLDKAPGTQKESLDVLAQRNWALWSLGEMRELRKGIDAGLSRERSPEFLVQDGLWKLATNNASARASLEEALSINPGDIRALTALKQVFVMQRQPAAAVQKVKEYAARQPKSAPVQEFLGYLLWATGDRAAARGAFMNARTVDTKSGHSELALIQLDAVEMKWNDAADRLNSVLTTNPGNITARLWLGNVEIIRGRQAAALEQFRKVVEASPENPQALNNFAYLLAEHDGKLDEALKHAEKARELSPENPQYSDTLGWILYRKGIYRSAISHLERAAAALPKNPVMKFHLAMAYAKAGDLKRGQTAFQEGLKQNPNLPEAKSAKEILARN